MDPCSSFQLIAKQRDGEAKIQEESSGNCYITQLPEFVLYVLLSYFDTSSLYCLSQTCVLFNEMLKHSSFWRYIDCKYSQDDLHKFNFCCQRVNSRTTHFLCKGESRMVELIKMVPTLTWCNLKVVALENQYISGDKFTLNSFPTSLEELSLRKTYIYNGGSFLYAPSRLKLRVLLLDHCQWFDISMLTSMENILKTLEILSLYMCKKGDVDILGNVLVKLKRIKILDLRYASLSRRLLKTMHKTTTLQELYLSGYSSSYELDKMKRKLAIHCGSKQEPDSYMSDDEENLDTSAYLMKKRFGDVTLGNCQIDGIADEDLKMFANVKPSNAPHEKPKSFLFKYPYSTECKCGFRENGSVVRYYVPEQDYLDSVHDDDETKSLKYRIKRRLGVLKGMLKLQETPLLYYVVYEKKYTKTYRMRHFNWIYQRPPQTEKEIKMLEHTVVDPLHMLATTMLSRPNRTEDGDQGVNAQGCALNTLSLRGYPKVTDVTLGYLDDVPLKLLDVTYTNVTAEGVNAFMIAHPECRVVHESACICAPRIHF